MAEVSQLLDQEIPEGRQHLQESYVNLDKVAQYCRENYLKVDDKAELTILFFFKITGMTVHTESNPVIDLKKYKYEWNTPCKQ